MTSILLALVAPSAFAADIECVDANGADAACEDNDSDGSPANAADDAQKDCDDANADVHPGADVIIGDGVANRCDGTDDDTERAQAVDAVGGPESAKGKWLAANIDGCLDDPHFPDAVWRRLVVDGKVLGYSCTKPDGSLLDDHYAWSNRDAALVSPEDEAQNRRARRVADQASAKADEALERIGYASKTETAEDGSVVVTPATGLMAEIERLNALLAEAEKGHAEAISKLEAEDANTAEAFKAQAEFYVREMSRLRSELSGVYAELDELALQIKAERARIDGHDEDIASLERTGVSLGVKGVVAGSNLPGMAAEICTEASAAGCVTTSVVSVRDDAFVGGGGGAYVAVNTEDIRVQVEGGAAKTAESGDNADGEGVEYAGVLAYGTVSGLVQVAESAVMVGASASIYGHDTAKTEISSRVSGTGFAVGPTVRIEIPISGPAELALVGNVSYYSEAYGTVVGDVTGEYPHLDKGSGVIAGVGVEFGVGPSGR
jgi:hypothetical protein